MLDTLLLVLPVLGPAPFQQASATQEAASNGYRLPPKEIVDVLDAAPTPDAIPSPDGKWMLLVERTSMPSIADVTRTWIGLAGIRIDPQLRAPQTTSFVTGLSVRAIDVANATVKKIELPKDARVIDISWSPMSTRVALTAYSERTGLAPWIVDVASGSCVLLSGAYPLNAVLGRPFAWMPGGDALLFKVVPVDRRGERPRAGETPSGPSMQETTGRSSPLRTYEDLLKSGDDEAALAWYGESWILEAPVAGARTGTMSKSGLYASMDASPDGKHILVTRIERPFSYVLPWSEFPRSVEVWSTDWKLEHVVAHVPLGDDIPMEGVHTGPRDVAWQPTLPATLVWCEALDGGDPKRKAEKRDRWMRLSAPFSGSPETMFELAQRARGLEWLADPAFVSSDEHDRDRRWTTKRLHDLAHPEAAPRVLDDRSTNDRYGDPGRFATVQTLAGDRVLRQDGGSLYRVGQGASKDGERPFLDRFDLASGKSERVWQCEPGVYESVVAIVASSANAKPTILTSRESPSEPPNLFLRNLENGARVALTSFPDPQPAMRGIEQKLVKYKRKDGVDLSATLYLPKDRKPGERLPLFVWAYPLEYSDAATAGQVSGSPDHFVRVRGPSQILFALHGYAVMDNASMPVVGDPETMNDTFLDQIVMSAQAAIDAAVELGAADRERCAVGGHSYGAFMTANLLAHCDLFKAGVSRSGAYNRTLTPFGFQSERRTIWEAPKPYLELSPFLAANKIHAPILFIHGEKDDNQGTFPIQSERMYQAVKGNGGTARLVMLPGEAHGYRARESVMHTMAEMFDWCDRFVRDAKPAEPLARPFQPVEAGTKR
jgi:dipeptidyl aminopeptidase/acylaminoacyl peptidase